VLAKAVVQRSKGRFEAVRPTFANAAHPRTRRSAQTVMSAHPRPQAVAAPKRSLLRAGVDRARDPCRAAARLQLLWRVMEFRGARTAPRRSPDAESPTATHPDVHGPRPRRRSRSHRHRDPRLPCPTPTVGDRRNCTPRGGQPLNERTTVPRRMLDPATEWDHRWSLQTGQHSEPDSGEPEQTDTPLAGRRTSRPIGCVCQQTGEGTRCNLGNSIRPAAMGVGP